MCPLQVPTFIPAVMLPVSLYLVLAPIIGHPQMEFLYIFLFLLSGFLVYFLFFYFQCQPKCLQTATMCLQLLMEVAPTTKGHWLGSWTGSALPSVLQTALFPQFSMVLYIILVET